MKKIWLLLVCVALVLTPTACRVAGTDTQVSEADTQVGEADAPVSEADAPVSEADAPVSVVVARKLIDVPTICQYPALPTGCESVAATMVLQYYGDTVSAQDFARDWLICDSHFYRKDGVLYGPDPYAVFAGDPFRAASYGCFADPIVQAINGHSAVCTAEKLGHTSLESLCREYIDNDRPLLIWATMGMKEATDGNTWYLEDGSPFTWIAGEHCLVLVGYNDTDYFLNDPMTGSTVSYPKQTVEKRFAELGRQAVYIHK